MEKFLSRKFLLSVAAFLGSFGTGIAGAFSGNEKIAIIGIVCSIFSAAIYSACEAFVDGTKAGEKE